MNRRVGGYLVGWLVQKPVGSGASDCQGGGTRSPRGGGFGVGHNLPIPNPAYNYMINLCVDYHETRGHTSIMDKKQD